MSSMSINSEKRWIFGCGYLGSRVAELWHRQGHEVHVVTRSRVKAEELAARGWHPHVADVKQKATLPRAIVADRILMALGFDRQGPESIKEVYVEGLKNALQCFAQPPQSLIYISTTGVYGPTSSDWVDENSECAPSREGGQASLVCEQFLQSHAYSQAVTILRLAGIYGPGRVPNRAGLVAGEPIRGFSTGYLNLIHVDDAARVVDEMLGLAGAHCLNVSDGSPVLRQDYYQYLAQLYGAPDPIFAPPEPGTPKSQRGAGSKRVSNQALVRLTGFRPVYESYQAGLQAIVAESKSASELGD
jgi:nucleoside-diphosphate-sugar epimerase